MRDLPIYARWTILLILSAALIWPLQLLHLPAAPMMGAMIAAIIVSSNEGRLAVPRWLLVSAQTLIGCLMARSITADILKAMVVQWPVFVGTTCAVIACTIGLGTVMTRWQVLPGTTAIWGSAPGASSIMVLMAEAFGADFRLVAFMQYLRLAVVGVVATVVARLAVPGGHAAAVTQAYFAAVPLAPFFATVAIAAICGIVGTWAKVPGGAFMLSLVTAAALSVGGVVTITLPPLLLLGCFIGFGWFVGLRFTAEIVRYAFRMFPRILAMILALVGACGVLGYVLHLITGADLLTTYFATSPGGADAVAIIASSSHVDLPFVMAMQTARLLAVIVFGPAVARASARWAERDVAAEA